MEHDKIYEVHSIRGMGFSTDGKEMYLVRWKGFDSTHDTWQELHDLSGCMPMVQAYRRRHRDYIRDLQQRNRFKNVNDQESRKRRKIIEGKTDENNDTSRSKHENNSNIYISGSERETSPTETRDENTNSNSNTNTIPNRTGEIHRRTRPSVDKKPAYSRDEFEAMLKVVSTPDAPIRLFNEVDDEPCPPLEFKYTDGFVYGENVPQPDPEALPHCDCGPGECKWGSCKCMQDGPFYDDEGRLTASPGVMIRECNIKCGCDANCRNRVVQNGSKIAADIFKTPKCGWGVRAAEFIPYGTFFSIYAGEIISTEEADYRGQEHYDPIQRTYLFDLDFHLNLEAAKRETENGENGEDTEGLKKKDEIDEEDEFNENGELSEKDEFNEKSEFKEKDGLGEFNEKGELNEKDESAENEEEDENEDLEVEWVVDAMYHGNISRFLNHSCEPNLFIFAVTIDHTLPSMYYLALFANQDIEPGTELTFDYAPASTTDLISQEYPCHCGAKTCRGQLFTY